VPTLIPYGGRIVTNTRATRYIGGGILGNDGMPIPEEGPEAAGDLGGVLADTRPEAKFDMAKFNDCVSQLFQTIPAAIPGGRGLGLVPANGNVGSYSGHSLLTGTSFTIFTDAQSKNVEQLTKISGTAGTVGYTYFDRPYLNYVASDQSKGIYGLSNQVHETGNAIAYIINQYQKQRGLPYSMPEPKKPGGDRDPGAALEECVFGGRVSSDGRVNQ